jgi:glycogen debranching enzyme
MKSNIQKAYDVAKKCLRACYSDLGIYAGKTHFEDYWARDGLYASLGSTAAGDYSQTKKELALLLSFQKKDGQLPLRIGSNFIITKLLGLENLFGKKDRKKSVRYIIDRAYPNFMPKIPVDQNSLFVVAAEYYMRNSRDIKFAKENYEKIKKTMDWNFRQDSDSDLLIEEGFYCSWLDGIKKSGKVMYSEACHYAACASFAKIAKALGRREDCKKYSVTAEHIKEKINSLMWNGSYYTDWISFSGKRHESFSTDGNLLAIMFGISDNEKASSIISKLSELGLENGVPYRTNSPAYKWYEIDMTLRLALIPDYHNGMSWLWIGAAGILAKAIAGKKKNAVFLAEKIADEIIQHNGPYEVYERKSGLPVKRIFYKSEFPFAWAAGLFLYAVKESGIKK